FFQSSFFSFLEQIARSKQLLFETVTEAPSLFQNVNQSLLSFSKAGAKVGHLSIHSKYSSHFFLRKF
ncbi:hypothetical protein, partial [uncultured Bacteroides sp.]|uniref:hypothetical protein n=1 Tax=uncultured Bacteroides sp. TaxID=162156 RepID=UPI002621E44A